MTEYYVNTWALAAEGEMFFGTPANAIKVTSDGASVGVACAAGAGTCITGPDTLTRNCSFDDGSRYWTVGANWTISNGKATHATGSTATLSQANALRVGETYDVYVVISGATAGSVTVSCGSAAGTAVSASGFSCNGVTCAGNGTITITPTSTFDGSIDEIRIYHRTGGLAANVWHPISAKGIGKVSAGSVYLGWTYRGR
jgi:hypothetical protein